MYCPWNGAEIQAVVSSRQLGRGLSSHFCYKHHPYGDNFGSGGRQHVGRRSLVPQALSITPWLPSLAENTVILFGLCGRAQTQKEHPSRSSIWDQPGLTHQLYQVIMGTSLNEWACLSKSWFPQLQNENMNTYPSVESKKECTSS